MANDNRVIDFLDTTAKFAELAFTEWSGFMSEKVVVSNRLVLEGVTERTTIVATRYPKSHLPAM